MTLIKSGSRLTGSLKTNGLQVPTCADETGAAAMDQVVIVGQDERAALLDLQAVLVTRYLPLTGPLRGGEILSTQPGFIGRLWRR